MVIFNLQALLTVGLPFILLSTVEFGPELMPQALGIIAADLLFRCRGNEKKLFSPAGGGHVFFVPGWMLGIVLAFLSLTGGEGI